MKGVIAHDVKLISNRNRRRKGQGVHDSKDSTGSIVGPRGIIGMGKYREDEVNIQRNNDEMIAA